MDSVRTLPTDLSTQELGEETKARQYALSLIEDWFKDIEARAQNFESAMAEESEEEEGFVNHQ